MIFSTYAQVRAHYEKKYESGRRWTLNGYQTLTLSRAIEQATSTMELTQDGWKKDGHKRYSKEKLLTCRNALLADRSLLKAALKLGFDALLCAVGKILDDSSVQGVKELGRYDFAIKIGATLGVEPEEKVYIHRKPLEVARLIGLPIERGDGGHRYVKRSAFDPALTSMPADSLENMLCICSKELVAVAHRVTRYR